VFVTKDGKTWSCESEDFRVGQANYTASYEVLFKTPQHDQYTILETNPSISVGSNNTIFTKEIPTTIKLTIKDIRPSQDDLTIQVLYDEQPLVSPSGNEFEVLVENAGNHIITIQLQKPWTKELQILKTFTIQALQEDIVGKLLVTPDTVGIDPFTVTFDASVTTVNDPDDEIVAFTRDFGDGDIKRNVSQGVINHTYNFNIQTQEGTYYPKVTMMTKKWHVLTTKTDNPIIVKKTLRNVRINFISHPAQQAKLKDAISFSLTADGTPKTITRTFGDERVECSGRDCMDVTHSFPTAGSYDISVTVTYQDHPDVTDSAKIIIME